MFAKRGVAVFTLGLALANAQAATITNLLDTTFDPGSGAENGFVEIHGTATRWQNSHLRQL